MTERAVNFPTPSGRCEDAREKSVQPVLVWIFYGVVNNTQAEGSFGRQCLLACETLMRRQDCMHVGLGLGVLDCNGVLCMHSWEFGANIGRSSGMHPLYIRQQKRHTLGAFEMVGRSALYLKISPKFIHEFLNNFVPIPLLPPLEYALSTRLTEKNLYTALPRPGVDYPKFKHMICDAACNVVRNSTKLVYRGKDPTLEEFHDQISKTCQCAQFSLWPLLSIITAQTPECREILTYEQQARVREALKEKTGLHPATVKRLLCTIPAFKLVDPSETIILGDTHVLLQDICVLTGTTRYLPDQLMFLNYRKAISGCH